MSDSRVHEYRHHIRPQYTDADYAADRRKQMEGTAWDLSMNAFALLLARQRNGSGSFELIYGLSGLGVIVAWTLWDRHYRRVWQDWRSRTWMRIEGQFDEGEVVVMRKARSQAIAGYQVWLSYEYKADGDQAGVYTLPCKTENEAEEALKRLSNRRIVVRVSPRKANRSHVSDEDISQFLQVAD